ncbi:alpha/beta hydrolase [Microlunatus endophyticus]
MSFQVNGTKTYGTLEVPARPGGHKLAAALLISGSGPNDRDGNQPKAGVTPGTLKLIADELAADGVMTLRYDKYGSGKTGPAAVDPKSLTVQTDLKQAAAAYAFLAAQQRADPDRLLIVGHSEGGMFALDVAGSASPKPAGLALLEPQDERILDLVRIQVAEATADQVSAGKLSSSAARTSNTAVARVIQELRAGEPVDSDGMAPIAQQVLGSVVNEPNTTYTLSWDKIDPVRLTAAVRPGTRVMITEGTLDTNVPRDTIGPLQKALDSAGVTGPGLTVLQGADHEMHLSTQPITAQVLAPAATKAIQDWAQPYATKR